MTRILDLLAAENYNTGYYTTYYAYLFWISTNSKECLCIAEFICQLFIKPMTKAALLEYYSPNVYSNTQEY